MNKDILLYENLKLHKYNQKNKPKNVHIGQRKLLLCEIAFLTRFAHESNTVVYAGAAPGIHIPYLASLFPQHVFECYDLSNFEIEESDSVHLHREYFSDEVAKKYKGILFISDIRSTRGGTHERSVDIDNIAQEKWVHIMKPAAAMLKFRPPFDITGSYIYLDGEIMLQPWSRNTSAEVRLIVQNSKKTKEYCIDEFESKMSYLNNVLRMKKQEVSWDLLYELHIWNDYYDKYKISINRETFLSENILKVCKLLKRDIHGKPIA